VDICSLVFSSTLKTPRNQHSLYLWEEGLISSKRAAPRGLPGFGAPIKPQAEKLFYLLAFVPKYNICSFQSKICVCRINFLQSFYWILWNSKKLRSMEIFFLISAKCIIVKTFYFLWFYSSHLSCWYLLMARVTCNI